MKRSVCLLMICVLFVLCCAGCRRYTPTGELYKKTPAHNGDADVSRVISMEAAHKSYEGEGDITVPMTVGFGHLPEDTGYGKENNTFYLTYSVYSSPRKKDNTPVWEKKVAYPDAYGSDKYASGKRNHSPLLFFADYGEFYPLYKEEVEIVFPAEVKKGYFEIALYHVIEGQEVHQYGGSLSCDFARKGGVLTLDPNGA